MNFWKTNDSRKNDIFRIYEGTMMKKQYLTPLLFCLYFIFCGICSCNSDPEIIEDKSNQITTTKDVLDIILKEPDSVFVALTCDKPWEQEMGFPTIVKDNNRYIMYYGTFTGKRTDRSKYYAICVAESTDGINWVKPELGLNEFDREFNTNIISYNSEGVSIEKVGNVFYMLSFSTNFNTQLYKSFDGYRFELIEGFEIPYCCDSPNHLLYNEKTGEYHIFLRSWNKQDNKVTYNHRTDSLFRTISLIRTNEIENFQMKRADNPSYVLGPNYPPFISNELPIAFKNTTSEDYDIYNPCIHKYAEGVYLAYPSHYYHFPDVDNGGDRHNDGDAKIAIYESSDAINFRLVNNQYLQPGCWCEFVAGHFESNEHYIHYWINFDDTHGALVYKKNSITGRIHKK